MIDVIWLVLMTADRSYFDQICSHKWWFARRIIRPWPSDKTCSRLLEVSCEVIFVQTSMIGIFGNLGKLLIVFLGGGLHDLPGCKAHIPSCPSPLVERTSFHYQPSMEESKITDILYTIYIYVLKLSRNIKVPIRSRWPKQQDPSKHQTFHVFSLSLVRTMFRSSWSGRNFGHQRSNKIGHSYGIKDP